MPSVTIVRVESPSQEQIDASVALFVLLMKDDLAARSLCGDDLSLIDPMARSILLAGILDDMLSTPEERKLGFNDFFARLSEEGREYYKSAYVGKFTRFVTGCMGRTGKVDSWWLNMIQVHPDRQRQGIATALIGLVREKAKRKGETLALSASNPSNVPIYKAMGFDLKGDRIMPSPWGDWPLYLVALDTRDQI